MIPYKMDFAIEQMNSNEAAAQGLVEALTGKVLPQREAVRVWNRIPDHKWYLSERLGRDVGTRVAAIDFLENFYEPAEIRTFGDSARKTFNRALSVLGSWTRSYLKAKSGAMPI